MPKTDEPFLTFHWNIEKKSKNVFKKRPETAKQIAEEMSNNLRRLDETSVGLRHEPMPFVGFLQEVKGKKDDVNAMCRRLKKEFKAQRGADGKQLGEVKFEAFPTGGKSSMAEWTIVVSQGLSDMTIKDLDARAKYKKVIEDVKTAGKKKKTDQADRLGWRARSVKQEPPLRIFLSIPHEAEDFRNGVIAEVEWNGETHRISSIHAPGPDIMKKEPRLLDAIQSAAQDANVDVITADTNVYGSVNEEVFRDLGKSHGGTTIRPSGEFSNSQLDRVLALPTTNAKMRKPILPGGPEKTIQKKKHKRRRRSTHYTTPKRKPNATQRLTDHGMIVTEMGKRLDTPIVLDATPLQSVPLTGETPSPLTMRKGAAASTRKMTTNENALEDPSNPLNEEEMTDVTQMGPEDDAGGENEDGGATEDEGDAAMEEAATEGVGAEAIDLLAL